MIWGFVSFGIRRLARYSSLGLWLLPVLIAGCQTAAERHILDSRPGTARLKAGETIKAETDSLVEPLLLKQGISGMAVGVVTPDGLTHTFGYGGTGRPGIRKPPGPDSLFQIGSISKLFVETLLARMVEQGLVRYEDTVGDILPTNILVSASVSHLTLYELATHTSGLPREPFCRRQFISLFNYLITGRNLYGHLSRKFMYSYLRHARIKPKNRGRFRYSNIGIGLLAALLEIKAGRPATDLIRQEICLPLALSDSVFFPSPSQQARLTVGHVGNQACWKPRTSPMAPWDMGDWMRPSAGMYSSLNDLLTFAKANIEMISTPLAPALAETHRVQINTARGGEAFGWLVKRFKPQNVVITFKDGFVSGYSGYIGLDMQRHLAVVVLSNTFSWDDRVGNNLLLRLSGSYPQGIAPYPHSAGESFAAGPRNPARDTGSESAHTQ